MRGGEETQPATGSLWIGLAILIVLGAIAVVIAAAALGGIAHAVRGMLG